MRQVFYPSQFNFRLRTKWQVSLCLVSLIYSSTAHSQNPDKPKAKDKDKAVDVSPEPAAPAPGTSHLDYNHEFSGNFDYQTSEGSLKSETTDTTTKINSSTASLNLMYGYLLGDHAEPFVEIGYRNVNHKIADYDSNKNNFEWGLGILFNIPDKPSASANKPGSNAPGFSNSTWIPYGGLVVASTLATGSEGISTKSDTNGADMITKLIFGTRYILVPHLGLNFSLRLSHQSSKSVADASGRIGGSSRKTTIEAQLLGLTVLM